MTQVDTTTVDTSQDALLDVFGRRARHYDLTSNVSGYLTGMRMVAYRRQAVALLRLRPGDTVVDAGCGTGLNFPRIQERIGPSGKIVGVDLSDAMLDRARERVRRHGWRNVTLVHDDLARFAIPPCDGILGFLSVTLSPAYDEVIRRGFDALRPGRRFVLHDYRIPAWLPDRLTFALEPLIKPFGGSLEMAARHPWESIARYAARSRLFHRNLGFAYFSVGEKGSP